MFEKRDAPDDHRPEPQSYSSYNRDYDAQRGGRGYDRPSSYQRERYDRRDDRRYDGPRGGYDRPYGSRYNDGRSGGRPFSHSERQQLKELVHRYNYDYQQISQIMNRSPIDCQRQYLQWDSQPEWDNNQSDEVGRMYDSGKSIQEIASILGNRSEIGIYAKLFFMYRKRMIRRVVNEIDFIARPELLKATIPDREGDGAQASGANTKFQVTDRLINAARGLAQKAKNAQFESCKQTLHEMLQMLDTLENEQ